VPIPFRFHVHPLSWVLLVSLAVGYGVLTSRPGFRLHRPSRQRWLFAAGWGALLVASTWPLADLAERWSFAALMGQRVLVMLVAPPLLLLALPPAALQVATRPVAVERALRFLTRFGVATVLFTGAVIASMLPPVVAVGASGRLAHGAIDLGLFLAAAVMWLTGLRLLPGITRLSTAARMGFLLVQSLLPNFPALILIFARHSFYPVFAAHVRALGLSPVADQEIAGAIAKILGLSILWAAAGAVWSGGRRREEAGLDPDPLTWDEVERELRHLERLRAGRPLGPTDPPDRPGDTAAAPHGPPIDPPFGPSDQTSDDRGTRREPGADAEGEARPAPRDRPSDPGGSDRPPGSE